MSKLTKAAAKAHEQACRILEKDALSLDDRWFVLEHWQESARHINSTAGAFFTPLGLARDFAIEVGGRRIIDLCAGIGTLSFFLRPYWPSEPWPEITCVEVDPDYVAVGRKVLPEATWVEASVFDLPADIGHFDTAIGNPPFGRIDRGGGTAQRWRGSDFELQVIDIASDLADAGVFIVPQMSAPFSYSGDRHFRPTARDLCARFRDQTDIELKPGIGIDTSFYRSDWRTGIKPVVEVVTVDFVAARRARAAREAGPLFAEAAE